MVRARKLGVLTAVLYAVDVQEASISMERVDGSTVKALLHSSTLQGAGAVMYAAEWSAAHAEKLYSKCQCAPQHSSLDAMYL